MVLNHFTLVPFIKNDSQLDHVDDENQENHNGRYVVDFDLETVVYSSSVTDVGRLRI